MEAESLFPLLLQSLGFPGALDSLSGVVQPNRDEPLSWRERYNSGSLPRTL